MKLIATVLIVATAITYVLLGGFERDNTVAAYAPITQQQIQLAHQAALHSHYRGLLFWWALLLLFVLAVVAVIYRTLYVPAVNARERVPVDASGMYPEIVRDVTPLHKRLAGDRKLWIHNPNMVAAPYAYATLNGTMQLESSTEGATAAEQLEYAANSWGVQRTAAALGGFGRSTVAAMRAAAGVYDWQAKREQARTQLYQQRMALAQPAVVEVKASPHMHATLTDALAGHTGYSIVLGQSSEDGDLALWNPHTDAHMGVWGKTGMGKTSRLGLTVALNQLRQNYRVIVIDPEQEGDEPAGLWAAIAPWAQVVGPGEPGCTLWDEIMQWYEQRWQTVQAAGATAARYMPGKPLRPLAIHFDEIARWRAKSRRQGGAWAKYAGHVDDCLSEIAQRGLKRGCHLIVYGQLPGDLPDAIAGNLLGVTMRQAANQGNKVGHWHAHELSEGQFVLDGRTYNAWQPLQEAAAILRNRRQVGRLLSDGACVRGAFVDRSQPFATNDSRTTPPVANVMNGGVSGEGNASDILAAIYERSRSWDDVAAEFFAANPGGKQAELRRIMANIANDGRNPDAFKGEAHRLYHTFGGIA